MKDTDHILVVDDDPEIRSLLSSYLQDNGYRVTSAADGKGMWKALAAGQPDLIVLDLMLPDEDGLQLCRALRGGPKAELPVIMLTARGEDVDRILGLEMGADDYLPKPFNPRELLARIKGVLRRVRALPSNLREETPKRTLRFAGWTLDTVARELLSPDSVVVPLSGTEYRLLLVFMQHPNKVISRDQLMDLTRGREAMPFDRSIDVQVSRLRTCLHDNAREPSIIKTVRSEGYVLAVPVEAS